MIKYRLYNNSIFLYEGFCDKVRFEVLKKRYNFGNYKIDVIK